MAGRFLRGSQALASAGITGGIRGVIGLSGPGPVEGWEDVDPWWQHCKATAPDVAVADDDPLRLMYTSGTESRPKGVLLSSRSLISQYVSCIVDGGMSSDDVVIKTGGENVASREVEEALYGLDGVAEVAVFGISHPHWIEAVTAVVVPKPDGTLSVEDVQAHSRTQLAPYKRPKYVVITDALPKNPSGKVLKRDLREQYAGLATEEPRP